MFRQLARLPLRRCLHSQAGPSSRPFTRCARSAYALGASAAVAGYLAWSWSPDGRRIPRISLDSSEAASAHQQQPASLPPSPVFVSPPRPSDASTPSVPPSDDATEPVAISTEGEGSSPESSGTLAEGEEDAQQESSGGAFNPETGEINWDCPCLGGMAHGPCGEQFREAFSCFVYSQADPKGIDCVEKFKAMQECFREHPDVYADEIMDEEEEQSPAGTLTTEKTEGDLHSSDSPSPPTTEQVPTSTLS